MAKVNIQTLSNLTNEVAAIAALNANFTALQTAIENTLSRDGTTPNQMTADLDMNSKRILNVPAPTSGAHLVRLSDLTGAFTGASLVIPSITGQPSGSVLTTDGTSVFWAAPGTTALLKSANLSDLTNIATARSNLGLNSAALQSVGTSGAAVGLLNANKTDSGNNIWTGTNQFNGIATINYSAFTAPSNVGPVGWIVSRALTGNTTIASADVGKQLPSQTSSTLTLTIPNHASDPIPVGIPIRVSTFAGGGAITISPQSPVVLRWAGTGSTGARTLATESMCFLEKRADNDWIIMGAGIS